MIAPIHVIRIELTSGVLSGPTRCDRGKVVRLEWQNVGRRIFFVDMIEGDGSRITVFDTFDYGLAIVEAEDVASDAGAPVIDLVAEVP